MCVRDQVEITQFDVVFLISGRQMDSLGLRIEWYRRKVCGPFWSMALALMLAMSSDYAVAASSSDLLVEVNGETISSEDLDSALGVKLIQLQEQLFN